jgi:hypothetical protein
MNTSRPRLITILGFMAFHVLHAGDPNSVESQAHRVDAAMKRVRELSSPRTLAKIERQLTEMRERLTSNRRATTQAYEATARVRQDHEIIDPDPESADVVVSARNLPDDDPIVAEYMRLKNVYIEAKNKLMKIEQEHGKCTLAAVNLGQMIVNSTSREVADVFKKLSELIENGEVTDPNPDDAKSEIIFNSTNKETAEYYLRKKAKYHELKIEAANARIQHAAAIVDELRWEACNSYRAAATIRQKDEIADPDPENAEAIVSSEGGAAVAEYLQHKKTFLQIKTEIEIADSVFPIAVLQAEVDAAQKETAEAFAKIAEFLQSSKVTDPDPDSPESSVSLHHLNKEAANNYLTHKAHYLALKARVAHARKALAAAKARKPPATGITK